jgi:glycerol-3-phosphate dehydrogenase (NAD(P)+)
VRLISAAKGIELESQARMSQVAFEEGIAADRDVRFAVLSGPSFAAELARGMATAVVIAAEEPELATLVQAELSSPALRLYSSSDVVGVELGGRSRTSSPSPPDRRRRPRPGPQHPGGADHPRAARDHPPGDRLRRPAAHLRRSRRPGRPGAHLHRRAVAQPAGRHRCSPSGKSVAEITGGTSMVAEGIRNSLAVARLARPQGVEMPITEQVGAILHEGKPPRARSPT